MTHNMIGNYKYYLFEPGLLPVLSPGGRGGERGLLFDDTTKNKGYVMKPLI